MVADCNTYSLSSAGSTLIGGKLSVRSPGPCNQVWFLLLPGGEQAHDPGPAGIYQNELFSLTTRTGSGKSTSFKLLH